MYVLCMYTVSSLKDKKKDLKKVLVRGRVTRTAI